MARDRSLDEFAVDGASESDEADSEDVDVESDVADDRVESDAREVDVEGDSTGEGETDAETDGEDDSLDGVDPATSTYRWDPDGIECPSCGETVDRLWSQDGEHVCSDCKEW
jgi:hypothetical protein